MSSHDVPSVTGPGRERPFIVIVDAGLAIAIQNALANLANFEGEANEDWPGPDWDFLGHLSDRLGDEIATRFL